LVHVAAAGLAQSGQYRCQASWPCATSASMS